MSEFGSLCLYLGIYALSAVLVSQWCRQRNVLLGIIGLSLPILMAAFRYAVGSDFWLYMNFFSRDTVRPISDIFEHFYSEGGFHTIAKISGIVADERLYFGICAALTLVPVILTFKKRYGTYLIGLFTLIYLLTTFTTSLNIMRQGIAIAFTFVASTYIFKRDIKRFALWIFVAMMFHLSAIIFAPAYFLYSKNNSFNFKQILFLGFVFLCIISASSVIESLSGMEGIGKYSVYSEGDSRAQNRSIILTIILLMLFFFRRKKMQETDPSVYTFLIFSVIAFLIEMTGSFSPFIKRCGLYYGVYNLVLACIWIKSMKLSSRNLAKMFIICFFIARFVMAFYVLKQANIIPYNTKETYNQSII